MTLLARATLLIPLLAGCYEYQVIQPGAAAQGSDVRARVSAATSDRIAPLLGLPDARVVTGTVVQRDADGSLVVEVPTAPEPGPGGSVQSFAQRVSLGKSDILELESRKLDVARTGVVVGAIAVIGGSAAIAALHGSPGTDKPPVVSGTEIRIPVWRLRF
jgi:hypothetical protein